jgi:hypothetical protein
MTREELTAQILEVVSAQVQTDWKGGVSSTEAAFTRFAGAHANKAPKSKFVRPPLHEDEAKWKRMKGHIAGSASARGMSGERWKAYVFGAMRKRGWKPRKERVDETMDVIGRTSKRYLETHGQEGQEAVPPRGETPYPESYACLQVQEEGR